MQNSLSFLLILISAVFQVKGWADDNLFTDDLHDPNAFFSDSSSDSFTLIDVAGGLNQDENAAFDTLPSLPVDDNASLDTLASLPVDEDSSFDTPTPLPEDEDNSFDGLALPPADEDLLFDTLALYEWHEVEPEPVVVDCPATDGLGKRDDTMFCPTDDFKAPDLPTLDGITDKLNPPNEKDDALRQISPLNYQAPPGDYSKCPPNRPFQLCCNCNGNFEFEFCNDCLQLSVVGACFAPYIEVCCGIYGVVAYDTPQLSFTNLDILLAQYSRKELDLDNRPLDGTIAQRCQEVLLPNPPPPK